MTTTFEVLYLGIGPDIDPTEGNDTSENAGALVGLTIGSAGSPLAFNAQHTFSPVDYSDGDSTMYDADNSVASDTFSIEGGATQTYDSLALYNATISYTDGRPDATITAVVFQDSNGNLYLAPELSANSNYAAMTAAPFESITLDSVAADTWVNLIADRQSIDSLCFMPQPAC